ncbi:type II toxin-antitoxin system RelE family toxin [Kocuria carniphila]|uniref:type II toxin-antitoxin system RelE family toxin n=1 Tax=Kocuria carniphila TaxID=262208 RepID=UPI00390800E8
MAWTIKITAMAKKQLGKLDKTIAKRIVQKIAQVGELEDPRVHGKALTSPLSGLWRYRVGDYGALAEIRDEEIVILILEVDHRSRVYRSQ